MSDVAVDRLMQQSGGKGSVLPVQFAGEPNQSRPQFARSIMLAEMKDVFATILRCRGSENAKQKQELREVLDWIRSQDTRWVYSFENTCDELGYDCGALRRRLISIALGKERGQLLQFGPRRGRKPSRSST